MRGLTLSLVAVGTLLGSSATGHATPPAPLAGIQRCGFAAVPDDVPGTLGGPNVWNGVAWGGPIVAADLQDLFANAVDGRLTCSIIVNGGTPRIATDYLLSPGETQSYVFLVADQLQYTAAPGSDVQLCGTLDLVNAHGETASFDLGCSRNAVIPGTGQLCDVTQFLPATVRDVVEPHLDCPEQ